jgi:hypothetical protein
MERDSRLLYVRHDLKVLLSVRSAARRSVSGIAFTPTPKGSLLTSYSSPDISNQSGEQGTYLPLMPREEPERTVKEARRDTLVRQWPRR